MKHAAGISMQLKLVIGKFHELKQSHIYNRFIIIIIIIIISIIYFLFCNSSHITRISIDYRGDTNLQ